MVRLAGEDKGRLGKVFPALKKEPEGCGQR